MIGAEFDIHKLAALLKDDTAATAIEYGLIAAGISIAIIGVVNGPGSAIFRPS